MTALHRMPALWLGRQIRDGKISSLEVTDWFLDRIQRFGDAAGAFISVTAQTARQQAKAADTRVPDAAQRHPLWGVPTAVKDLFPARGTRTTYGSAAWAGQIAEHDAHVVRSLRAAAMPLIGKTNTAEFGFASYTEPEVAPPARSPWQPTMSAGGSSGGSAAAVAAGLVPVAQGSDSAGSIRIPASMCGIVGVKTTRGRISNGPDSTERFGLLAQGVLSRTVADAAAMLDCLCLPAPGARHVLPPLPVGGLRQAIRRRPGRLRVTAWTVSPLSGEEAHEECLLAVAKTASVLEAAGHTVTWAKPPNLSGLLPAFLTLWTVSCAAVAVPDGGEGLLQPLTRALREQGSTVTGVELSRAMDALDMASADVLARMDPWDVLLTPTLSAPPCLVGGLRDDNDPWDSMLRQAMFAPFTTIWNCTGHPALSLPAHWTAEDLPVGVQLVGPQGDETLLLQVAAQLEEALGWPERFPDEGKLSRVAAGDHPAAVWA
jgi:amidase